MEAGAGAPRVRSRGPSWRAVAAPCVALLGLALLVAAKPGDASELVVPRLESAVTDRAGLLAPAVRERLEAALRHLHEAGGAQLAVLTLPSLGGLPIERASIQIDPATVGEVTEERAGDGLRLADEGLGTGVGHADGLERPARCIPEGTQ